MKKKMTVFFLLFWQLFSKMQDLFFFFTATVITLVLVHSCGAVSSMRNIYTLWIYSGLDYLAVSSRFHRRLSNVSVGGNPSL